MSTLFAILSSLIRAALLAILSSMIKDKVYTVICRNSLIRVYYIFHSQQSDQSLHCLPFSTAVWSGSTLFAILYKHYYPGIHCLQFSAVWSGSTLFAILSSLARDYTICHSQQSDQGQGPHCHSQEQSAQGLHYLSFSKVWSGLHRLPFSAVWSTSTLFAILSSLIRVYTVCHSQQSDRGLHYLPFSVWSWSTVFAILSSLIRVYTICRSF